MRYRYTEVYKETSVKNTISIITNPVDIYRCSAFLLGFKILRSLERRKLNVL